MNSIPKRPSLYHKPLVTDIPPMSLAGLAGHLRDFCLSPLPNRLNHLQRNYDVAFDGYSYPGQEDSLNQGAEDQLHSFVFSDFSLPDRYPTEFQDFIRIQWPDLCRQVHAIEQSILQVMGLNSIAQQHQQLFGHMMSANYYPGLNSGEASELRLSAHPDVSLLTVFIQGIGNGFQYRDASGRWCDTPATQAVTVFAGELLEWLTDGEVPALTHRVRHEACSAERFSFALFSLPQPGATLTSLHGASISTEQWYRLHLSQWDDVG